MILLSQDCSTLARMACISEVRGTGVLSPDQLNYMVVSSIKEVTMAKRKPNGEYFRRFFTYEKETGELRWRRRVGPNNESFNKRWANKPAFTAVNHYGFRYGILEGEQYPAHKVIWAMVYGIYPAGHIKHVNGKKTDNRISNLKSGPRDMHLYRAADAMLFTN